MGSWGRATQGAGCKVANMKAFLFFTLQLSSTWSIPLPQQGFSHSSDVHHVSVTFGNPQAPQLPVALAHPPKQPAYTLQAVHPIQAPIQPPFNTLTVHSPPLHHHVNPHPALVHHQVGHHPVVHHQVGHQTGVSLHPVTPDRQLVSVHPLAAAHFYRLAPDHPAPRAPAFFSSELLPVKVEDLVPGSLEVARGPKQLEEIEEIDSEDDIEDDSKDGKDEAEKKEKEEGTEMVGRTPRLLVIEDLEEDGSAADDQELDDIVLAIDDLEEEGSDADDEELDDILEDLVTAKEEENSTDDVFKSEPSSSEFSPENDSTEEAASEEIEALAKEIVSSKKEVEEINREEEEGEKTFSDSKDSESVAGVNSIDVERGQNNADSNEEKENITPLKGIKTILVVTTNQDKNDPAVELPEKIAEATTVNSTNGQEQRTRL